LRDLLRYVEMLAGGRIGQRGQLLYFVDGTGAFGKMIEKTFPPPLASVPIKNVEQYLFQNGIEAYEDSSAYIDAKGNLVMRNLPEKIGLYEAVLESGCHYKPTFMERWRYGYESAFAWVRDRFRK